MQPLPGRRGGRPPGRGAGHLLYTQICNVDERMDLDVLQWRPAIPFYIPREPYTICMDIYGSVDESDVESVYRFFDSMID